MSFTCHAVHALQLHPARESRGRPKPTAVIAQTHLAVWLAILVKGTLPRLQEATATAA